MADAAHGKIEDNPKILSGPVLANSPNAVLSKTLLNRYNDLPLPVDKIIATYVWIDGSGEHLRCKDRTLNFIPKRPTDKLTILLCEMDNQYWSNLKNTLKCEHMNEYVAPFFFPKDLESVYDVRCKLRDQDNGTFDENLKGFTAIKFSADVEMLQ